MKINITAALIAFIYNVINFLFWLHISTMPNATSMVYVFIYPCFWVVTLIVVAILGYKNKVIWFSKTYRLSTTIALIFCTPIPFLGAEALSFSSTYCSSTGFVTENGHTLKDETWLYNSGGLNVRKYWKNPKPNCDNCDSSTFVRDSIWVYLNKNKDTIQIDTYENGKLIKEVKK